MDIELVFVATSVCSCTCPSHALSTSFLSWTHRRDHLYSTWVLPRRVTSSFSETDSTTRSTVDRLAKSVVREMRCRQASFCSNDRSFARSSDFSILLCPIRAGWHGYVCVVGVDLQRGSRRCCLVKRQGRLFAQRALRCRSPSVLPQSRQPCSAPSSKFGRSLPTECRWMAA